jgi:predicted metalloprotease with PDZ domain
MMPVDPTRAGKYRPLLLAMAIVFAAATVVYSVAWMYYVRVTIKVEIGMDTTPVPAGIQVKDVWPGGPAEIAGLRPKDVITAIDGRNVATHGGPDILNQTWLDSRPGDVVQLTLNRPGELQPLTIEPVFRSMKGSGDTASLARRGAVQVIGVYPLLFLEVGLSVLF